MFKIERRHASQRLAVDEIHVYHLTSGVNGHYLAILPPHGTCERVVLEGDPDMLALLKLRRLGRLVQAIST